MRYRVAVLDSVNGHTQGEVREYRSVFDTSHAALYYPWIRTYDPFTEQYIAIPPSGSRFYAKTVSFSATERSEMACQELP